MCNIFLVCSYYIHCAVYILGAAILLRSLASDHVFGYPLALSPRGVSKLAGARQQLRPRGIARFHWPVLPVPDNNVSLEGCRGLAVSPCVVDQYLALHTRPINNMQMLINLPYLRYRLLFEQACNTLTQFDFCVLEVTNFLGSDCSFDFGGELSAVFVPSLGIKKLDYF